MPKQLTFNGLQDATLVRLRLHERRSWDSIAERLCVSRQAVIDRFKKLGHGDSGRCNGVLTLACEDDNDPNRIAALPAGHPTTWGLLLANTASLTGCGYGAGLSA